MRKCVVRRRTWRLHPLTLCHNLMTLKSQLNFSGFCGHNILRAGDLFALRVSEHSPQPGVLFLETADEFGQSRTIEARLELPTKQRAYGNAMPPTQLYPARAGAISREYGGDLQISIFADERHGAFPAVSGLFSGMVAAEKTKFLFKERSCELPPIRVDLRGDGASRNHPAIVNALLPRARSAPI